MHGFIPAATDSAIYSLNNRGLVIIIHFHVFAYFPGISIPGNSISKEFKWISQIWRACDLFHCVCFKHGYTICNHDHLTWMSSLLATFFTKQWVAVTTHSGWIKVPPQNGKFALFLSWVCHGQSPCFALVPPTILVFGRIPQEPGKCESRRKDEKWKQHYLEARPCISVYYYRMCGIKEAGVRSTTWFEKRVLH